MLTPSEPSPDSPGGSPRQRVHGIPTAFFAEPESEDGRVAEAFEEDKAAPHLRIRWSALELKAVEVGMIPVVLAINPHGSVEALSSEFIKEIEAYLQSPRTQKERVLDKGSFVRIGDLDDCVRGLASEATPDKAAPDVTRKFDRTTRLNLSRSIEDQRVADREIFAPE